MPVVAPMSIGSSQNSVLERGAKGRGLGLKWEAREETFSCGSVVKGR